jgi:ABC-type Fe3+ transport system permease subunit
MEHGVVITWYNIGIVATMLYVACGLACGLILRDLDKMRPHANKFGKKGENGYVTITILWPFVLIAIGFITALAWWLERSDPWNILPKVPYTIKRQIKDFCNDSKSK